MKKQRFTFSSRLTSRKWLPYSTMDALKAHLARMAALLATQDNQAMLNTNGAGADTAKQDSHDAGSELFQSASSGKR